MSSRITLGSATALASLFALSLSAGCLRRDVAAEEPTTKISFETVVPQPAIDKVDLLVMVDNSSSMADKQRILGAAVPDLLRGLVQPKCVDKRTRVPTGKVVDPLRPESEHCAPGSEPAFRPITDMHIGVISSSLGGMGSETCKGEKDRHNDDKGRLVARSAGGGAVAPAGDLHFLAWYPDVEKNQNKERHPDPPVPATRTIAALEGAFTDLVVGVGQDGCGLEAQLESVYHFLVQPDPWTDIVVADKKASYGPANQVDVELLRQRAAFLRPDSLVAVIVLTDEDDSSVDPLALQGSAYQFGDRPPLPRATAACENDPLSPKCTSCAFAPADASCSSGNGFYAPESDSINVRFHAMKRRYGVDPQFPIARYVDGFTKNKVPRRASEHDRGLYVGKADCTNPLFAAHLPTEPNEELCNLPRGPRTKDLVYFAVIGGVPNELLPAAGSGAAVDWTALLGRDPARYDDSGVDAHMIASTTPRPGLPPPSAADDADPVHGREWITNGEDLQYACTFDLYGAQTGGAIPPEALKNKCTGTACDCDGKRSSPLCAKSDPAVQLKAKAYPTRRELMVARELGDHAVVASLCAKQLTSPERDDYGYRPAVRAITDKLEATLTASCLPRPLARDKDATVPCLVLATLPEPGSQDRCAALGLRAPPADVLDPLRDRVALEDGEASRLLPVCEVPQVTVAAGETCRDETRAHGFCYAENVPGAPCAQSLLFTQATQQLAGARFTMQCITVSASAAPATR